LTHVEIIRHLEALRRKRGLSQADLARKMGIHPTRLSRLETGTQEPGVATLAAWCDALGARLEILA
jgi:transcriptional regulator with XRE-family HTH domain